MSDKLVPIAPPAGLFKNGTRYQAEGRWYDAHLVRFFDHTIRPVGGWRRVQSDASTDFITLVGTPRAALAYRTDASGVLQVIGTTKHLYAVLNGALFDITPAAFTVGRTDTVYTSANGAYGAGPYGAGPYGVGSQTAALSLADTWQLASFGNSLAAVPTSNRKLYVWAGDPAVLPTVPAGAPATARGVVVTPERFLFALGAAGNARRVQWPSQESTTDWTPSGSNTAGDFDLTTNGSIICGRASRGVTLIWTDSDLHAAQYIGGTLVYRFTRVGENCGIIAPGAAVMVDGQALWMGRNGFFRYDGYVKQLESEVQDYVFGDFNTVQAEKVWGQSVSEFGEVWWFYPSASSSEIDRYVVYNYVEDHWTVGRLQRTAGYDAGAVAKPVMIDAVGVLYEHEVLYEKLTILPLLADGTVVGDGDEIADGELSRAQEVPYLESGPMELGDGDNVMRIQRIVPDARTIGDIDMRLYAAFDPTSTESEHGPYSLTQPTSVEVTARQLRVRFDEVNQIGWRIGAVKLGIRQSSRR